MQFWARTAWSNAQFSHARGCKTLAAARRALRRADPGSASLSNITSASRSKPTSPPRAVACRCAGPYDFRVRPSGLTSHQSVVMSTSSTSISRYRSRGRRFALSASLVLLCHPAAVQCEVPVGAPAHDVATNMPFVVDQQGRKLQEKDILKECRQRQLESLPPLLDQHGRSLCGGGGGDEPVPNEIDDTNRRKLRYNCAEVNCRDAVFCRRQLAADAGLAPDPVITADAAAVVDVATATSSPGKSVAAGHRQKQ